MGAAGHGLLRCDRQTPRYSGRVILEIVTYGHPVLREKGKRVGTITPELRQLAANMLETMYHANGVGLAAQQVGQAIQLTVIDVTGVNDRPSQLFIDGVETDLAGHMPMILVNPSISNPQGSQVGPEGCLSIPDITANIRRADRITVTATDLDGRPVAFDCAGLLSRAAQHEIDHLNGILFIDRMDTATKAGLAGQLKRMQQETASLLKRAGKSIRSMMRA